MTIKIIDNCMPDVVLKNYFNMITSGNFPWHFTPVVSQQDSTKEKEKNNFQFANTLYQGNLPKNELFNHFNAILNYIPELQSLVKFKINCNPCYSQIIEHDFHVDVPYNCNTAIIYLNTNDGYTLFETGEKVNSVENRMVIFPSQIKHTGTTCTDQQARFVININYF